MIEDNEEEEDESIRETVTRTLVFYFILFRFVFCYYLSFTNRDFSMGLLLYPTVATTTGNSVSYTFSVDGSVGLMTGSYMLHVM